MSVRIRCWTWAHVFFSLRRNRAQSPQHWVFSLTLCSALTQAYLFISMENSCSCEKQTQTGTKHKTKVHRKHITLPLQLFRSNEDVKINIDFVAESSQHAIECWLGCLWARLFPPLTWRKRGQAAATLLWAYPYCEKVQACPPSNRNCRRRGQ